jgi:hypothetical protein
MTSRLEQSTIQRRQPVALQLHSIRQIPQSPRHGFPEPSDARSQIGPHHRNESSFIAHHRHELRRDDPWLWRMLIESPEFDDHGQSLRPHATDGGKYFACALKLKWPDRRCARSSTIRKLDHTRITVTFKPNANAPQRKPSRHCRDAILPPPIPYTRAGELPGCGHSVSQSAHLGLGRNHENIGSGQYTYSYKTLATGFDPTATNTVGIYSSRNLTSYNLGTRKCSKSALM